MSIKIIYVVKSYHIGSESTIIYILYNNFKVHLNIYDRACVCSFTLPLLVQVYHTLLCLKNLLATRTEKMDITAE